MNVITRGIRNAFRNSIRTFSIIVILGLSIGLALAMVIARNSVQQKINSVKSSIGDTVTIAPAGFSGFSQVNNALTTSQLSSVSKLPHVTSVDESLTDRLTTIGSATPSFFGGGSNNTSSSNNQTSLTSPVTINTSGGGSGSGGRRFFISGGGSLPANFTPPISIVGTTDPTSLDSTSLTITSGQTINGSVDTDNALISSSMASKNNLKVGSTFSAYGTTMTVSGIFTSSTQTADGTVIVALPTEQRLSAQSGDVTSAVATVDSLDNLSSATTAIKNNLGSSADVTSSQDQANQAIQPLNSVKSVSLYSMIGAASAGAVIILLTMIMIVRERRREIGVLKAIGASNLRIMFQFMAEAVTFTAIGAVVGVAVGVVAGNPITNTLVSNSTTSTSASTATTGGSGGFRQGGGFGGAITRNFNVSGQSLRSVHAVVSWDILLYGLGAALLIAVVGSAVAALLISKVRPAEVMRTE